MRRRNILLTVALVAVLISSLFLAIQTFVLPAPSNSPPEFYVGIQCGYGNVTLNKILIDRVKNYTNLFIIGATDIVKNATLLNEVADYAYAAGLHFSVYFSVAQTYGELGENITQSYTFPNGTVVQFTGYRSSLPTGWLKNATAKYGDYFLGAYVFDEPGGNQLDGGTQRVVNLNYNTQTDYATTANAFVGNVSSKIEGYRNTTVMTFTSDYGLYWFDYTAGYDAVLAQFGGSSSSRQLQVSLSRGAADVQSKDWGIMVTHKSRQVQVMESGPELYDDLVLGYESGAEYAVVFDFAETQSYPREPYQPGEFGILLDEHFDALKNFWSYVQKNPSEHGNFKADVALVLPAAYGFGLRNAEDNIWGIFSGDRWSQTMWSDVNSCLNQYGSRLDIVYDDAAFNGALKNIFNQIIYWSASNASSSFPVRNLNTTFGYQTIQEAIDAGATSDGQMLSVKAGTYRENLVVSKSLSIIGEDKATTIIDGGDLGTPVTIARNGVEFAGFTIKNSGANGTAGILLNNVGNCSVTDNTITANYYGVALNNSGGITLRNNALNGNVYSLSLEGNETSNFIHDIDGSNTVDGKKVYYLVNTHGLDINPSAYPDVGYLALVNSTGINVQGLSLSNNGNGILLVGTQNSTLTDNTVADSIEGIRLLNSENNVLRNNRLSGNTYNFWVQNGYVNNVDASNTVEGKPIYYWVGEQGKTVPSDAGFVALIDCSGITVQNLNLSKNWPSIVLSSTSGSTIAHNQMTEGYYGIVLADASNNNTVSANTVSGIVQGIMVSDSKNNGFTENTLSNNQYGGYFISSNFNTLSKNAVNMNTDHGLQFSAGCSNNTLTGNQIDNNSIGVEFTDSSSNSILQNSLTGNQQSIQIHGSSKFATVRGNNITGSNCGVEVAIFPSFSPMIYTSSGSYTSYSSSSDYNPYQQPASSLHIISGNTLTNNKIGIAINAVNDTVIADNTVAGGDYGIALGYQTGSANYFNPMLENTIAVTGNIVTNSRTGIYLTNYNNCSITKNSVVNCSNGISLSISLYNSLYDNNVSGMGGIQLSSSAYGNQLRRNSITANTSGFRDGTVTYSYSSGMSYNPLTGEILTQPKYLTNDVDASNTVNGKPIYYWVGQSGKTVPSDAGSVILVNCTNITVQNLDLTGNYDGIQLAYTNDSLIMGNVVQNNSRGITLLCSSNNKITNNDIDGNIDGIRIEQRTFTTRIGPDSQPITVNYNSMGNFIVGNNITSNTNGVGIGDSFGYGSETSNDISGNTFYHNNFVNNKNQVVPSSQGPNTQATDQNSWDNGKVGNYWSDYNGTDANHDGIGDLAYQIKAKMISQQPTSTDYVYVVIAEDHFPLIQPFLPVP